MVDRAERIQEYTAGLDREAFDADRLTYDATLRNLSLVSVSAARIPETVRAACPDIPWSDVVELHGRLTQGYRDIDDAMVWAVIEDTVATLLQALRTVLIESSKDTWVDG